MAHGADLRGRYHFVGLAPGHGPRGPCRPCSTACRTGRTLVSQTQEMLHVDFRHGSLTQLPTAAIRYPAAVTVGSRFVNSVGGTAADPAGRRFLDHVEVSVQDQEHGWFWNCAVVRQQPRAHRQLCILPLRQLDHALAGRRADRWPHLRTRARPSTSPAGRATWWPKFAFGLTASVSVAPGEAATTDGTIRFHGLLFSSPVTSFTGGPTTARDRQRHRPHVSVSGMIQTGTVSIAIPTGVVADAWDPQPGGQQPGGQFPGQQPAGPAPPSSPPRVPPVAGRCHGGKRGDGR